MTRAVKTPTPWLEDMPGTHAPEHGCRRSATLWKLCRAGSNCPTRHQGQLAGESKITPPARSSPTSHERSRSRVGVRRWEPAAGSPERVDLLARKGRGRRPALDGRKVGAMLDLSPSIESCRFARGWLTPVDKRDARARRPLLSWLGTLTTPTGVLWLILEPS